MTILKPEIYSFDVFDTCVTRAHAYPRDLFYDLGLRLAPEPAGLVGRRFAQRFQRARINAEKMAHWRARRKGSEHADIFSIYRQFRWLMQLPQSVDDLVAAELELEEESLYAIYEMAERLRCLREQGHRVVFISDMYIPSHLLAPLLARLGIMREGDGLYVSCDIGASKHSGRLFRHVLDCEGVRCTDILHTGDDVHADIAMARALGIRTSHFTAAHLTECERRVAGSSVPREPAASWQAALSRRCRLAAWQEVASERSYVLDGVVFAVIVPFLLAYVQWVLEHAREHGIKRLYFVARDGEILASIAKGLRPGGVELRYLFGSRRAWLAPSIVADLSDWKRLLAVAGDASAPSDIVARTGLSADQQSEVQSALGLDATSWHRSLSQDEASAFIELLTADPGAGEILFHAASRKRNVALAYLSQEGLMDGVAWALVDAGWSLNGQAALKRILSMAPQQHPRPVGYYIGLAKNFLGESAAGGAHAFCNPPGNFFSRRRVVVEHCFLPATHPSTRDYIVGVEEVVPDFGPDPRSENELAYARRLHAAARVSAKVVADMAIKGECISKHRTYIKDVASDFIRNPGRKEAMAYSSMQAVADLRQEGEFSSALCRPLRWADVWRTIGMATSRKLTFKVSAWMWLEGSIVLSPWHVAVPLRLMLWVDGLRAR